MALARHWEYRSIRRYVEVDGDNLRAAVERLADRGCHPDAALVDSLLKAVENQEGHQAQSASVLGRRRRKHIGGGSGNRRR